MLPLAVRLGLAVALAPASADLEWSAPPECPPAQTVEAAAAALLGRPLDPAPGDPSASDPRERVRARGSVAREPGGFRLELEVRGVAGVDRRTLRDRRCQVLAEAAALILATAVDPTLAAGVPPPLPPESPETWPIEPDPSDISQSSSSSDPLPADDPEPTRDPLLTAVPVRPPPRRPPDRARAGLRLHGLFDQGSLPGPTGGPGLAVGLLRRAWRVELGFAYLAPREIRPDPARPTGARLSLWTASIRACAVAWPPGRLELAACAALEAGALVGAGFGVPDARTRAQPWLAVTAGPELAITVRPRFAFTLGVDAVLAVLRPSFMIGGLGTVFTAHPAGFRGLAGIQVRLP